MEKGTERTENTVRNDAGNDKNVDSATSSAIASDRKFDRSNNPDDAVTKISRQRNRSEAGSETGSGSGSEAGTGTGTRTGKTSGTATKSRAQKSKKSRLDLNAEARRQVAGQVAGLHKLVGITVGQPQLVAISDEQAENLTNAALDVMQHYDMSVSPVVAAWANLAAVCATIYAPKFMMIKAMRKQAREQRQAARPQPGEDAGTPQGFDFSVNSGAQQ